MDESTKLDIVTHIWKCHQHSITGKRESYSKKNEKSNVGMLEIMTFDSATTFT